MSVSLSVLEFSWHEDSKLDVLGQKIAGVTAVSNGRGGAHILVLENIFIYADSPAWMIMLFRCTSVLRMIFSK